MLQCSVCCTADISSEHSPEKGVGSVIIDFAFCVSPVQALPGSLLHHTAFHVSALTRTARFRWAVVDLFGGCGALAGRVDRGHAASLWLGLGHALSYQPASMLPIVRSCTVRPICGHCSRVLSSVSAPPKWLSASWSGRGKWALHWRYYRAEKTWKSRPAVERHPARCRRARKKRFGQTSLLTPPTHTNASLQNAWWVCHVPAIATTF